MRTNIISLLQGIVKNNGDSTVTFTVTHFSIFVFGNEAEETKPATGEEDEPEDEPQNKSGEEEAPIEATLLEAVPVTSPKTGENMPVTLSIVAICAGMAAVVYRRKLR